MTVLVKIEFCYCWCSVISFNEPPFIHSTCRVCPYYLARELKNDADIIFMPYNYLLDPKVSFVYVQI